MKFGDLKSGDRFIFSDSVLDRFYDSKYGILTYTKLQKPVHCQRSIIQMSKNVHKKTEMKLVLDMLCDDISLKAYTATSEGGELVWVREDADVLKLCS